MTWQGLSVVFAVLAVSVVVVVLSVFVVFGVFAVVVVLAIWPYSTSESLQTALLVLAAYPTALSLDVPCAFIEAHHGGRYPAGGPGQWKMRGEPAPGA